MQKKCENIYLYPRGEDGNSISVILSFFQKKGVLKDFYFIDDGCEETSLACNKDEIIQNGELWIVHQDLNMQKRLYGNVSGLPNNKVYNGIIQTENLFLESLEKIDTTLENEEFEEWLQYVSFFLLSCAFVLKGSLLASRVKEFAKKISYEYKKYFKIPSRSLGIVYSGFSGGKHFDGITAELKKRGVLFYWVCYDRKDFEFLEQKKKNAFWLL